MNSNQTQLPNPPVEPGGSQLRTGRGIAEASAFLAAFEIRIQGIGEQQAEASATQRQRSHGTPETVAA